MRIVLIQPRHSYAPSRDTGMPGHIYMPGSLLTVAARLEYAGCSVEVLDENLDRFTGSADVLGVNIVGAPYISIVQDLIRQFHHRSPRGRVLVGGAIVDGLKLSQLSQLFGADVENGNNDAALANAVGILSSSLPRLESTSLVPAFEKVPDQRFKAYLENEFSLYLSQGCKYSCTFCAARRTRVIDGKIAIVVEQYRDISVVISDVEYLVARAKRLGLRRLRIYLSNLDMFQSPGPLSQFARSLAQIQSDIEIEFRGLATANSFLQVYERQPELIAKLVRLGLKKVGFGIDGATPKVWRSIRKPNTESNCIRAIEVAYGCGIIPETLMVFGHNGADTASSLQLATDFMKSMTGNYNALPRAHVAKDIVPGNDGWANPTSAAVVELLMTRPNLFQALDFTALPSSMTHPDKSFRAMVTDHYVQMCELPGSVTQHVRPFESGMSDEDIAAVTLFNTNRYDL